MSAELVQLVEQGYKAWNSGDRAWVLEHMSPQIEWITPEDDPDPAPTTGTRGRALLGPVAGAVGQLNFKIEEILDAGDSVVVVARRQGRGEHSGLEISDRVIQVFQFEGGKCVRVHEYYDRDAALSALRGERPAAVQAPELTAPERRLELWLRIFSAFFVAQALIYPALGLFGSAEFPFVANSFAKDCLFAVLCFLAAGNVRQQGWATLLVIGGHLAIVAMLLLMLVTGNDGSVAGTFGEPFGTSLSPTLQLLIWLAAAAICGGRARPALPLRRQGALSLKYLWPHQHRRRWRWPRSGDRARGGAHAGAGGGGVDDFLYSLDASNKGRPGRRSRHWRSIRCSACGRPSP